MLKRLRESVSKRWQSVRLVAGKAVRLLFSADAMAVASLAALAYGFWLAWEPLGFIVPGTVVLSLAVVGKLRG